MNSFEDFHCAGFYLPVNQEKKNEGKELSKPGGGTWALHVLPPTVPQAALFPVVGAVTSGWGRGLGLLEAWTSVGIRHTWYGHNVDAGTMLVPRVFPNCNPQHYT